MNIKIYFDFKKFKAFYKKFFTQTESQNYTVEKLQDFEYLNLIFSLNFNCFKHDMCFYRF